MHRLTGTAYNIVSLSFEVLEHKRYDNDNGIGASIAEINKWSWKEILFKGIYLGLNIISLLR